MFQPRLLTIGELTEPFVKQLIFAQQLSFWIAFPKDFQNIVIDLWITFFRFFKRNFWIKLSQSVCSLWTRSWVEDCNFGFKRTSSLSRDTLLNNRRENVLELRIKFRTSRLKCVNQCEGCSFIEWKPKLFLESHDFSEFMFQRMAPRI